MARTYNLREDEQERAAIAVWVHLTKEQADTIERFADSAGNLSLQGLLRRMTEEAIERAIASQGKDLPVSRSLWASRKQRGRVRGNSD